MGAIIMRSWDFRKFGVQVNLPSLIWQVRAQSHWVIIQLWRHLNPFRHLLLLISHIPLYPPHGSYLHPASLTFSSTTLSSLQGLNVKSSCSISPCHDHEFTLSALYTECNIVLRLFVVPWFVWLLIATWIWLQFLAYLPSYWPPSSSSLYKLQILINIVTFPRFCVNSLMKRVSPPAASNWPPPHWPPPE